jgi:hypothetical protein
MRFHLRQLMTSQGLDAAARHYEEHGYCLLDGVDDVTALFRPLFAERLGIAESELDDLFHPDGGPIQLPLAVRQRLSRVDSTPELTRNLFAALEPLLLRLLGPFVHVSSTFHAQFKGGQAPEVDHGGYKSDYLEVQGQYLLHQDFTGARIPTSPSGVTLWVAQNTSPDWTLRIYPGSHRHGLICNRWLPLDDSRLGFLGAPMDIQARRGSAVVFNALILHGSSNPGPRRRVSCDIRFFPLCGFLPSEVHILGDPALARSRGSAVGGEGPTLRAPRLEGLAFLGRGAVEPDVPEHSILNWANYLQTYLNGDAERARAHLERFVNTTHGVDDVDAYTSKFYGYQVCQDTVTGLVEKLGQRDAGGAPTAQVSAPSGGVPIGVWS